MRPDRSFKIYPRPDNEYKKKDSLDFQRVTGNLYGKRPVGDKVQAYLWLLCLLIGFLMGSLAFLLDIMAEALIELRWESTQKVLVSSVGLGWLVLVLYSVFFMLIASLITVYVGPSALGSGVAEAMGILNGVKAPDFISFKNLIVKFFGVGLAVSAGLAGGKEGPLIHMGSIVGQAVAYIPLPFTRFFRNDFEKRKLMAVGIASGVSAAFGAPIGGSLFAYELSKPNTFWSFSLTWKVFFASTISAFFLSVFKQIYDGKFPIVVSNQEIIKLGVTQEAPTLDSIIGAAILGFAGGLVGAFFIRINNRVNILRKQYLTKKYLKVVEALILIVLTVTTMFLAVYLKYSTASDPNNNTDICQTQKNITTIQFLCPDNTFDRLATLFFDSQSNTIRSFMSDQREILFENALIFSTVWFVFTTLTAGTAVPSGIFMPCILIGCGIGHMYSFLHAEIFGKFTKDDPHFIYPSTFAILGATAVLSGATRMTFALAVVMLETTSSIELFLPIIFTLFTSYGTGALLINKSTYLSALRSKNIPLLSKSAPRANRQIFACNVMSTPVMTFNFIAKVVDIFYQLENTTYSGFPVTNKYGRPIGIIERDTLITLIEKRAWYDPEKIRGQKMVTSPADNKSKEIKSTIQDDDDETKTNEQDQHFLEAVDIIHFNRRQFKNDSDDQDYEQYPLSESVLNWEELNQDFPSNPRNYLDIADIAKDNEEQLIDLRPYMIERPHLISLFDRFNKFLNVFKLMQLRQLIVVDDTDGKLQGIITRQDLFQYMTL